MKIRMVNIWVGVLITAIFLMACNNNNNNSNDKMQAEMYTCPMPEDSVFSDKPGKCPKCGMELVKMETPTPQTDVMNADKGNTHTGYACPMHPNIHADKPGECSICGMPLEKIKSGKELNAISLNTLLKPVNQQVVASVPMVHLMDREEDIETEAYGFITYDTRQVGVISSNIAGRIEKLYIKYRYQKINKGQRIMDIYSPELMTAQQNLLFLIKNDPENNILINASKQKLYLLGMRKQQVDKVMQTGKADFTVAVYSNYSGHIHESDAGGTMQDNQTAGMSPAVTTKELNIKEGMYLQKGQTIFAVFNPNRAWVVLNIFAGQAATIKLGNKVRIIPESNPKKDFRATISYIEPFYREGSKTLTARVYFDNGAMQIPIGSQVKATVFAGNRAASWLPEEAVLSLGLDNVVFVKTGESFNARKIETGIKNKHLVQVLSGLDKNEAVAANAQYLVDSESFIKTKL